MDGEADSVNEVSVEQIHVYTQSNSVSPTLSFCDAETQTEMTGEFLDRLEFELKSTGEEKDKLAKEKDLLTRDSKRLQLALKSLKFDILAIRIFLSALVSFAVRYLVPAFNVPDSLYNQHSNQHSRLLKYLKVN